MKKTIQILSIIILTSILALIVVFIFNPFNLRTKLIGGVINSYLGDTIENYEPLKENVDNADTSTASGEGVVSDKHPLLNEEQEKTLEEYGVDVSLLPENINPEMEACFVDKLGKERADEIVAGDSPTGMEIFKTRSCLGE